MMYICNEKFFKIMTTEEKAKAYDKALEVMRQWVAPCHTKEQLDTLKKSVFPELADSEDERIRKKLIEYFNRYREDREWWEGITSRDIISYLEMQKPSFRQIHDGIMWDRGLRAGIELGKQKECVAVINDSSADEDERIRKTLRDFLSSALGNDLLQRKCGLKPDTVLAYLDKQKNSVSNAKYIEGVAHAFEDGRRSNGPNQE